MDAGIGKNIVIRVVGVRGKCDYNHKKGQKYEHPFMGLCPYAMHTLWPYITTLRFGGRFPWQKNGKIRISCPNPDDLVVFELGLK